MVEAITAAPQVEHNEAYNSRYVSLRLASPSLEQLNSSEILATNTLLAGLDAIYLWSQKYREGAVSTKSVPEEHVGMVEEVGTAAKLLKVMAYITKIGCLNSESLSIGDWAGTIGKWAEDAPLITQGKIRRVVRQVKGNLTDEVKTEILQILEEGFIGVAEQLVGTLAVDLGEVRGFVREDLVVQDNAELHVARLKFRQISHDIGNPMNTLSGWLRLAMVHGFSEDAVELVNDGFSKIFKISSASPAYLKDCYTKSEMSPREILRLAEGGLGALKPLGIDVRFERDSDVDDDVRVVWDQEWASLVFDNLTTNAIKAMGIDLANISDDDIPDLKPRRKSRRKLKGQEEPIEQIAVVQKEVLVRLKMGADRRLHIVYEDNGRGLPERLAQRGEFLPDTSEWGVDGAGRRIQGSGIGMYEQTEILRRQYQGDIRLENRVDHNAVVRGARILVSLDAHRIAA
jgi:signal transduction histidine kinase